MAEAQLVIGFAGPHVSLQDGGRPGWLRYGVPRSGAMDRLALAAANLALGNPSDAPVIEVSRGGLTLECRAGALGFAVAGGGFVVEHAGARGGSWSLGVLRAGERLTLRPGPWGSWCYLALAGQIVAPLWLGSASTHGPSGFGGRLLRKGDALQISDAQTRSNLPRRIPCPVFARPRSQLHITAGPQERFFAPDALEVLETGRWRMTDAADRMGARLAGPHLVPTRLDMPSEPLLRGSIQIAGDGVATVLMADHQTTGGYPKPAVVLDCDLDGFAQCRPGQPLGFKLVTPHQAVQIARNRAVAQARYLKRLGAGTGGEGPSAEA